MNVKTFKFWLLTSRICGRQADGASKALTEDGDRAINFVWSNFVCEKDFWTLQLSNSLTQMNVPIAVSHFWYIIYP